MLLGQVADAIATPLVGIESDRTDGFFKYGKRKSWHLFGITSFILHEILKLFCNCKETIELIEIFLVNNHSELLYYWYFI